MPDRRYQVFKFGGTSVRDAGRIRRVVELVGQEDPSAERVVVVSALGGVTDRLLRAADEAVARSGEHRAILADLRARHDAVLAQVARIDEHEALRAQLDAQFYTLGELLDGVFLLRECTLRARDSIAAMGERMSAPLVAAAFRGVGQDAVAVAADGFILTDDRFGDANVLFDETNERVRTYFGSLPKGRVAVVTGFMGATDRGVTTTLGRSGSDYTATILAGALHAGKIVIWTDVDGVLSADPRLVPDAQRLDTLHYREAAELAYFGAKVLHPRTMRPLIQEGLPLLIKNTLNPDAPGTLITSEEVTRDRPVAAVTTIRGVSLVTIEGPGMVGVPGISARAFSALAAYGINILFITQASSEQSLSLVVMERDAEAAVRSLENTFELERAHGDVNRISARAQCAVLTAVGDGMRSEPGVAGRLFTALGRENINVMAMGMAAAQNSVTTVVNESRIREAVRVVHQAFAPGGDDLRIALVGATGGVGRALLQILDRDRATIEATTGLRVRVVAMMNSRQMRFDVDGLPLDADPAAVLATGEAASLDALVATLADLPSGRLLFVDCTASDDVPDVYPSLLENGIGIVTPNKRANTRGIDFYRRLQMLGHATPYYYETTVGAALPMLSTLRDLIRTGDRLRRIEGMLSGTLAFVFSEMAAGRAFSDAVRQARHNGFTEPDPRDDLMGRDVARKLLTLARETGYTGDLADVQVESLVPDALREIDREAFMERLPELDAAWDARRAALPEGAKLGFLGVFEGDTLRVGVEAITPDSPFYRLSGTDSMVSFVTDRYTRPLVVSGPGAGHEVTATGVLADALHAGLRMG